MESRNARGLDEAEDDNWYHLSADDFESGYKKGDKSTKKEGEQAAKQKTEQEVEQEANFTEPTIHLNYFSTNRTAAKASSKDAQSVKFNEPAAATSAVPDKTSVVAIKESTKSESNEDGMVAESSASSSPAQEEILDLPQQPDEIQNAIALTFVISDPVLLAKLPHLLRQLLTITQEVVLDSSTSSMSSVGMQRVVPAVPLEVKGSNSSSLSDKAHHVAMAQTPNLITSGDPQYQIILSNTLLARIVKSIESQRQAPSVSGTSNSNQAVLRRFLLNKAKQSAATSPAALPPLPSQTSSASNTAVRKTRTSQPDGVTSQGSAGHPVEQKRTYSSVAQGRLSQSPTTQFRRRTVSQDSISTVNVSADEVTAILGGGSCVTPKSGAR